MKNVPQAKLYPVLEVWRGGVYKGYYLPEEKHLAEKYIRDFGGEIREGKRHFIFGRHNQLPFEAQRERVL